MQDKLRTGFGGPVVARGIIYVLDRVNDQQDVLRAIELATGKQQWTFAYYAPPEAKDDPSAGKYKGRWKCPNPVASHTDCGQGRFFITGGYKAGCVMVEAAREDGQWKVRELFRNKNCGAKACKPVFYQDHLYANSTDFDNGLMCLDLSGKLKWKTSNDNENGSVLIADGKIFSLQSETGVLRLVRASPDAYHELASPPVCAGGNVWAPMAISDGKLLVRRSRTLMCLDVAAPRTSDHGRP